MPRAGFNKLIKGTRDGDKPLLIPVMRRRKLAPVRFKITATRPLEMCAYSVGQYQGDHKPDSHFSMLVC